LEDATEDEDEERDNRWQWCVVTFLLFQVGCTILFDERNKHINDEVIIKDDHC